MKENKALTLQAILAAAVALLVVSTAHCQCDRNLPSGCSTRTPDDFMEQYITHAGPVNISVGIDDLRQAENLPRNFIATSNSRPQRAAKPCNPDVCNSTCGFRPPNIFLDFYNQYGRANCPWEYRCDYDPQRIPQYLYHASCLDTALNSREVHYPIPVLRTEQPSCDPLDSTTTTWKWEMQVIPVACICDRPDPNER